MTPTVFRKNKYRFFFFSREEDRIHVHVATPNGEAKFWLQPIVSLALNDGLSKKELVEAQKIIEGNTNEIVKAWKKHFHR